MTALSSRFDLSRLSLGAILPGAAVIGALTVALSLSLGLYERQRSTVSYQMERYGNTLAAQIAALAAQPLMTGDDVALSRLVTRLGRADEVVTVGVYTLDNRALASIDADATISATVYSKAITFDETIAGYVRVGLDRAVFERPHEDFLRWATLISALATLVALGIAIALNRRFLAPLLELHDSAAALVQQRGPAGGSATSPRVGAPKMGAVAALAHALVPTETIKAVDRKSDHPLYALVLNLFNQVSLPSAERRQVLNVCRERTQKVCRLYNGRALTLPGTGVLALFEGFPDDDHAFNAICAALLARDLVSRLNHHRVDQDRAELLFRLALDALPPREFANGDERSILDLLREELQHTVLLSATARDSTVAISQAVHDSILDPARLDLSERRSAALQSLAKGGTPRCYLVDGIADSYSALLHRQAELLLCDT